MNRTGEFTEPITNSSSSGEVPEDIYSKREM